MASLGSIWGGFGALWASSWGLLGCILEPWASKNGAHVAPVSGFVDIAKTLKFLWFFNNFGGAGLPKWLPNAHLEAMLDQLGAYDGILEALKGSWAPW